MSIEEQRYLDLLRELVEVSESEPLNNDRTGVGTWSVFGRELRFDLSKGFPLITTKRMGLKSILGELLWFISGSTNADELEQKYGCTIWREWKDENGELGEVYGHQWRNFGATQKDNGLFENDGFDQISWLVNEIKTNPNSRRLIVSGWNPNEAGKVALPPCHTLFQFFVQDGKLSCQLYQRSADVFLGVPFNIASYALLTHMVAQVCGLGVGDFVWTGGDTHLYVNHFEQAKLQLTREPLPLCQLKLNPEIKDIFDFKFEDIEITGYESHPAIKAPVAV